MSLGPNGKRAVVSVCALGLVLGVRFAIGRESAELVAYCLIPLLTSWTPKRV